MGSNILRRRRLEQERSSFWLALWGRGDDVRAKSYSDFVVGMSMWPYPWKAIDGSRRSWPLNAADLLSRQLEWRFLHHSDVLTSCKLLVAFPLHPDPSRETSREPCKPTAIFASPVWKQALTQELQS